MSKQTDYGVVILCQMASEAAPGPYNARDLANTTHLPLPMVSKILKLLAKEGLLVSQRGAKGGYSLVREADSISVGEVIKALEGQVAITECCAPAPLDCDHQPFCSLPTHWDRINRAIWQALDSIKLSSMARPPSRQTLIPLKIAVSART